MTYAVIIRPKVEKYLLHLSDPDYDAVTDSLESLSHTPRPRSAIKLEGSMLWRVRVRQLRIFYSIDDEQGVVRVVKIARRSEDTYKGL
jgi:mRNA-degrading endonuclease RelE of RelBE toxin-antitoxin system